MLHGKDKLIDVRSGNDFTFSAEHVNAILQVCSPELEKIEIVDAMDETITENHELFRRPLKGLKMDGVRVASIHGIRNLSTTVRPRKSTTKFYSSHFKIS